MYHRTSGPPIGRPKATLPEHVAETATP